jgi:chitin synthase
LFLPLRSAHNSCPSTLVSFLRNFPVPLPETVFRALEAIQPFLRCASVENPSAFMQDALAATITMGLNERLMGVKFSLSQTGIDTRRGLLEVPREEGNRAFDVFYYLLASVSSAAEREFLGLKPASEYSLLSRTGTYDPPAYLPTADDSMAADDFRAALKDIGVKGDAQRSLLTTLAALLKLGDTLDYIVDPEVLESTIEDVAGLLSIDPEVLVSQCSTEDRVRFAGGLYEALVDWVIAQANVAIEASLAGAADAVVNDTVCLTVVDVPNPAIGRGVCMRGIFDDSAGINAEMFQDGLDVTAASSAVVKETKDAVAETGAVLGKMSHEREIEHDMRERVLERIAWATAEEEFVRKLLFPTGSGIVLGKHNRLDLKTVLDASRAWYQVAIHPVDGPAANLDPSSSRLPWVPGAISHQIRSWRLTEWGNRRNKHFDFTADLEFSEFVTRFAPLGCREGRDGIESWIMERGWSNGAVVVGNERVWMRENAWWEAETLRDVAIEGGVLNPPNMPYATGYSAGGSSYFGGMPMGGGTPNASSDQLVHGGMAARGLHGNNNGSQVTLPQGMNSSAIQLTALRGDYGLGNKGDRHKDQLFYNDDGDFTAAIDAEKAAGKTIETVPVDKGRRAWVAFVWALTFWIPSPLLSFVGRMKRPDVRMAWREKFVLVFLIALMNAIIVFWIVAFGKILCPNMDKVWSPSEVATHQADDDLFVSIRGKVYDISKFWRIDHSDMAVSADQETMLALAGMGLDAYFPIPLTQSCPGLGISDRTLLTVNITNTPEYPTAIHTSGFFASDPGSALHNDDWYYARFTPKIKEFYKGDLVWKKSDVEKDGEENQHNWFMWNENIYDLTDYFYTQSLQKGVSTYKFLDSSLEDIIKRNPGQDLTEQIASLIDKSNSTEVVKVKNSLNCIKNQFYVGITDFRDTPKCLVNNYIMLATTVILCAVILIKFLAALQFGSKRKPAAQDKFVICQVPAYTEGEDSLRKALDSLTGLAYDNKRKLICVICDGVIVGQGNDRPTPKIVLDILGVDPKLNPPALAFKSVGTGAEQLNYGKVYSGLYEFEGNVVPYLVVVKVGKESEQAKSKPGNRGKRDSQILLMSFLNRVHHRAPMNPLELEMFHQINNIIGVDPELYEYLLMVDADTSVAEDSLTRLVAACANDKKISGICGETSLENDEKSWWTMIQVYEYFISHHLAKAFESLFGSVTCLPGW